MSSFPSRFPVVYKGMSINDYPPYKALGEPLVYHGPSGRPIGNCACGRLFYEQEGSRKCACADPELAQWEKEHAVEVQQVQADCRRWQRIRDTMLDTQLVFDSSWYRKADPIIRDFTFQMDELSDIGCWECEKNKHDYCNCNKCPSCRYPGCSGYCYEEEDYDY